jgi:hypothetical protein
MRRNTKAKTAQNKNKTKQTGQGLLVRGGLST